MLLEKEEPKKRLVGETRKAKPEVKKSEKIDNATQKKKEVNPTKKGSARVELFEQKKEVTFRDDKKKKKKKKNKKHK